VRGDVEREEESGVGERAAGDLRPAGDVDTGEADASEDADDDEIQQLAVSVGQPQ